MRCPACNNRISEVVDSRKWETWVWRRRRCESCRGTWHTAERVTTEVKNSRPPVEHWRGKP